MTGYDYRVDDGELTITNTENGKSVSVVLLHRDLDHTWNEVDVEFVLSECAHIANLTCSDWVDIRSEEDVNEGDATDEYLAVYFFITDLYRVFPGGVENMVYYRNI